MPLATNETSNLRCLTQHGVAVSKWILKNSFITQCDFGDLNYDSDDLAVINLTIQMDYCILCY